MKQKIGLLLIDVQEDFLGHPSLYPKRAQILKSMQAVLDWARIQKIPVFHVHTVVLEDGSNAMPHWQEFNNTKCRVGSDGIKAPSLLEPVHGELLFEKQFFNAFDDPRLDAELHKAKIDTLVIIGLYTHACIRESVIGAYSRSYKVIIPIDAVASYDQVHALQTLKWLNSRAATCMSSAQLMHELKNEHSEEGSLQQYIHHNPCNSSQILFKVIHSTTSQIELIAKNLTVSQKSWNKTPIIDRANFLKEWLAVLRGRKSFWVEIIIQDLGKPRMDAISEVTYGLGLLENICHDLVISEIRGNAETQFHPHGLVAVISPWNNPFAIPISKIAAALGFGNVVIWKPALPASRISQYLIESLQEIGLDYLVELIIGDANAGYFLVSSEHVKAITFTGSTSNGKNIELITTILNKPFQAELGGNNAGIVLGDADIESAANDLAVSMFSFAGQRCTAIRRIIVQSSIAKEFAQHLSKAISSLRLGDPSDALTNIGPVYSQEHKQFLLDIVNQELKLGAAILPPLIIPKNVSQNGNWFSPIVFMNPSVDSPIWASELFGPVAVIQECMDIDSAIDLHNQVEQGLLGVIYTNNPLYQKQFMDQAEAGILSLNKARPDFSMLGPFSGWKLSGIGIPEHGRWNRDFYTRVKAVYRYR